jgi:hypothetical protein
VHKTAGRQDAKGGGKEGKKEGGEEGKKERTKDEKKRGGREGGEGEHMINNGKSKSRREEVEGGI